MRENLKVSKFIVEMVVKIESKYIIRIFYSKSFIIFYVYCDFEYYRLIILDCKFWKIVGWVSLFW